MLFVREARALSSHFWKARPFKLKFQRSEREQVGAGSMAHGCGVRVLGVLAQAWKLRGIARDVHCLSSQAIWGFVELQLERQEGFQARSSAAPGAGLSWPRLAWCRAG